jgi:hypothetical protein
MHDSSPFSQRSYFLNRLLEPVDSAIQLKLWGGNLPMLRSEVSGIEAVTQELGLFVKIFVSLMLFAPY